MRGYGTEQSLQERANTRSHRNFVVVLQELQVSIFSCMTYNRSGRLEIKADHRVSNITLRNKIVIEIQIIVGVEW
jgi:hypothetical protein